MLLALCVARSSIPSISNPQDLSNATTPHERGVISIRGLQTSQDSKKGRGRGYRCQKEGDSRQR